MKTSTRWLIVVLAAAVILPGCRRKVDSLVIISPHNKYIQEEFERAFSEYHRSKYGRPVKIEWRDVGGGGSKIFDYLRNVYSRAGESEMKIDIVWGGGEDIYMRMAAEGILRPMKIDDDAKANIPATFGGLEMYDPKGYWCGTAISGFGILYNADRLKRLNVPAPKLWQEMGSGAMFDLVALADPMQSASAAAAYEAIVQSGKDWPDGWGKLLGIMGNASRFYDGASGAADAVITDAPVATCVDFYGFMRAAQHKELVYHSPKGQTIFNPDPIGILKNPPHPELAQRFVDFVLSRQGQALLALPPGQPDGPRKDALMRQPIRKDVYTHYAGKLLPLVISPYEAGNEMAIDAEARKVRYGVLRFLIRAAAIDNADGLKKAKKKLIDSGFAKDLLEQFDALPPNVQSVDGLREVAGKLTDATENERIVTDWQRFFRDKYRRMTQ
ncbi:MAG TPA: extracellular solute-binding protein [Phycisphaerae bacterium]|nr:extracellular solute-binding protein [Phycisphaerae bacterium]